MINGQQIEQASESLSTQILDSLQAEGKRKVAVVEFTDLTGNVTPLGRLIAEELTSELFRQARKLDMRDLALVERSKLDEVLGEQRLGVRGLLDKRNVETFGRILGVEAILTGTYATLNDRIRINGRLIGVPSAELFATAAGYLSRASVPDEYLQSERGSAPPPLTPLRQGSTPPPPAAPTEVVSGVRFSLMGCRASGGIVTCEMTSTSLEEDREMRLGAFRGSPPTRIIDDHGTEAQVDSIQAGSTRVNSFSASTSLVSGVPLKVHMTFEGISPKATRLAVVEVPVQFLIGGSWKGFRVQFKGVPLQGR